MNTNTSVEFWMDMPIFEMFDWVDDCSEFLEEKRLKEEESWKELSKQK